MGYSKTSSVMKFHDQFLEKVLLESLEALLGLFLIKSLEKFMRESIEEFVQGFLEANNESL